MRACMHAFTFACSSICMYAWKYVCMHGPLVMQRAWLSQSSKSEKHTFICVFLYFYLHIYIYIYIYIYTHIYTHTYIYTYIRNMEIHFLLLILM